MLDVAVLLARHSTRRNEGVQPLLDVPVKPDHLIDLGPTDGPTPVDHNAGMLKACTDPRQQHNPDEKRAAHVPARALLQPLFSLLATWLAKEHRFLNVIHVIRLQSSQSQSSLFPLKGSLANFLDLF